MNLRNMCGVPQVMPFRPRWNRIGPKLPVWFTRRLKLIDPSLVMQFMPPRWVDRRGVDSYQFPSGVWVVCRRNKRTRWLFARWVWNLADEWGRFQPPGHDTLKVLKAAVYYWRAGKAEKLEQMFMDSVEEFRHDKRRESRARLHARIEEISRKYDERFGRSHVFFREGPIRKVC